jgi:transposase
VLLTGWISGASPLPADTAQTTARTLKKHLVGILDRFCSGLNNGFAEAINQRIQAAKPRAKGYGTDAHLITISQLVCAKLEQLPKNPSLQPAQPMSG